MVPAKGRKAQCEIISSVADLMGRMGKYTGVVIKNIGRTDLAVFRYTVLWSLSHLFYVTPSFIFDFIYN